MLLAICCGMFNSSSSTFKVVDEPVKEEFVEPEVVSEPSS